MSNNTQVQYTGISFFGLLTIVFITLKLLDAISWSWWWVLSPLWGPPVAVIMIYLLIYLLLWFFIAIVSVVSAFSKR